MRYAVCSEVVWHWLWPGLAFTSRFGCAASILELTSCFAQLLPWFYWCYSGSLLLLLLLRLLCYCCPPSPFTHKKLLLTEQNISV